jgi:predicted transcriptional regulator
MASRSKAETAALRARAQQLRQAGRSVKEVAEAVGAPESTVRRWLGAGPGRRKGAGAKHPAEAMAEMLRAEIPAVTRVLLDLAKGGDVRAAGLVMKLLGTQLCPEESDAGESEADASDLEQELSTLPADIAAEIVGLLAQAQSEATGGAGAPSRSPDGRGGRSRRLPWQAEDHPSDEGADSL